MMLLAAKNLARHRVRNTLAGLGIAVAAALLLDMVMPAVPRDADWIRSLMRSSARCACGPSSPGKPRQAWRRPSMKSWAGK